MCGHSTRCRQLVVSVSDPGQYPPGDRVWPKSRPGCFTRSARGGLHEIDHELVERGQEAVTVEREAEPDDAIDAVLAVALYYSRGVRVQIRAHRDLYVGAASVPFCKQLVEATNWIAELRRRAVERVPAFAELGHASQGGIALAADVDRRVRPLHRLLVQSTRAKAVVVRP